MVKLMQMRTNAAGIALIKEFEGCSLTAYQDGGGRWTVGWGHTGGAHEGLTLTQAEADSILEVDLALTETIVGNLLFGIQLTDNQVSALVSFCFNVGFGHVGKKDGFQVLKDGTPSTIFALLRAGDLAQAADEFPKWDKVGGAPCAGIHRRRLAERCLFLT